MLVNTASGSDSLGTGMGMAASYGRLVLAIGVAAWDASARLSTWVVGHCRGGDPQSIAISRPIHLAFEMA